MWRVYASRWLNRELFGGQPNEMLSSRVHRENRVYAERFINCLFFWHCCHCRQAYLWEYQHEKKTREEAQAHPQGAQSIQPVAETLGYERSVP